MFGDINEVSLLGNVTKDPDLRYTPSGAGVLSFSMATNRRYKKGEEWTDEVSYHNIVVWSGSESLSQRIKKGTRLIVKGRIQTRSWDDKDGKKQYKTEIVAEKVILIARYEGSNDAGMDNSNNTGAPKSAANAVEDTEDVADDSIDPNDLPF